MSSPRLRLLFLGYLFVLIVAVFAVRYERRAPAPQPSRELHLVKRNDLVVRNKYPDLFVGAKRDTSDPSTDCPNPDSKKRDYVPDMLLSGREMADFLMGRGAFIA